jgi:predicted HTH domain antitoxin
MEALASLVKKGLLSLADAAKEAGMSPDEFQMKTAGMK